MNHHDLLKRERGFRKRLYDAYASTHAGTTGSQGTPTIRRYVVPHLPQDRSLRILDIGCGQGRLVKLLSDAGYMEVSGIDVSAEQVNIAKEHGVSTVEQADLFTYLPSHQGTFDVIVALDVFEHLDRDEVLEALDLVYAGLRSTGKLIAQVPNGASPFMGRILYGDFTHKVAFTPRSIRQITSTVGFKNVCVSPIEPPVHGFLSAARLVAWKVVAASYAILLAIETGDARGHVLTQNVLFVADRQAR